MGDPNLLEIDIKVGNSQIVGKTKIVNIRRTVN